MSEEDPGVGQHWLGKESRDIRTGHRGNKTLNDFIFSTQYLIRVN